MWLAAVLVELTPRAGQQKRTGKNTPACFFKWYSPKETRVVQSVDWLSSNSVSAYSSSMPKYSLWSGGSFAQFLKKIHKPEAYFNLSLGLNACIVHHMQLIGQAAMINRFSILRIGNLPSYSFE